MLFWFLLVELLVSVFVHFFKFFLRMNFNWLTQKSRNYHKIYAFLSVPIFFFTLGMALLFVYTCMRVCVLLSFYCILVNITGCHFFYFSSDIFNGKSLSKKKEMLLDLCAGWVFFAFHTGKKKQWESTCEIEHLLTWHWLGFISE